MGIDPAILRAMAAAGASTEVIIAAVEAAHALDANRRETKRANNAERQRRFKERRRKVTQGNAGNALPSVTPPPNEYISNPPPEPQSPDGDLPPSSKIEIVVSEWNAMAARTGCTAVRGALTGKRLAGITARLNEHGLDGARQAIAAVARSPFCRGEVKDWRADFNFFVGIDNFVKLLEGGYDPPGKVTSITGKPISEIDRQHRANLIKLQARQITDAEFEQERAKLDHLERQQIANCGRSALSSG